MQKPSHLREQIITALTDLDQFLPGQAPIPDFVHHNTLHGFQHLSFDEALTTFEALTGIACYLSEEQNRAFYRQGRIDDQDLSAVFAQCSNLRPEQNICALHNKIITRQDIYRIALLFELQPVSVSQLNWQIEELAALDTVHADVPEPIRLSLLAADSKGIRSLWTSILTKLGLEQAALHPENMLDLSVEQAEAWLEQTQQNLLSSEVISTVEPSSTHQQMQQQAGMAIDELLAQVGNSISFRGIILKLTGIDVLDSVRAQLIRFCASGLDEGVASWQLPERHELGLYGAWRATAKYDANPFLHELLDWQIIIAELPEDAIDTIILQLTHLEIPQNQWKGYLRRLALEIPGWSGLINWRQHHRNYSPINDAKPSLSDYLAIRLTLDRLWLNQICRVTWKVEAKLTAINGYFRKNLSEFMVRSHLFQGGLPEYLTHQAESLTLHAGSERYDRTDWQQLADLIWTWQCCPAATLTEQHTPHNSGWRLFRLCQHLGLNAGDIKSFKLTNLQALLSVLDEFTLTERNRIWLLAYERHYRESFFQALQANHHRGRWSLRNQRPEAQFVFCMDDREEGFRRHLEEHNPNIETLGAAGFFGIAMNFTGLDDNKITPLCPVSITPVHEVREVPKPENESALFKHHQDRKRGKWFAKQFHQGLRRNLLLSHPVINVIAPITFADLLAKILAPTAQHTAVSGVERFFTSEIKTQLQFTATDESNVDATIYPKIGFTDNEQADRIAGFFRNIGLTSGFSKLIILMGHGSISQNNPHLAAYDCGACGGRHGGQNARVFAAMANRPEVRVLLKKFDITIPVDTWFMGAEHNTCNEDISWYDLEQLPSEQKDGFHKLQQELRHAQLMSAHERCRRLASAPRNPTPEQALDHIQERAANFSQVRPELGHATHASAVIGRRSVTQGAFFDRRVFLISYDPTQDLDGKVLEDILLTVTPIAAGINLEYYFSTVNNEHFGCGSKAPHNLTGFFGVMEGTCSDLRTGLPQQMVEIHEPMRLLLLIETPISLLEKIIQRQAAIREQVTGGWIQLSVKDPDTGEIFLYQHSITAYNQGFIRWQTKADDLPIRASSRDCYHAQTLPVAPVLINQPAQMRTL